MSKLSSARSLLCALIMLVALGASGATIVWAQHDQHDMQNMPGMNMGKPKSKTKAKAKPKPKARPKRKAAAQKKPAPKKDAMQGMDMSGRRMPAPSSPSTSSSPEAKPSPEKMDMNMPGMQMPANSASPEASPSASPEQKMDMNMPGMQMPSASPGSPSTPQASPSATPEQKMDMSMPMNMPMNNPTPQPSPPTGAAPAGHDMHNMPGMDMSGTNSTTGMGKMSASDPKALMIMSGNRMDIRIGSNTRNTINMSQMGSGTSWQPGTTPMSMLTKVSGDWVLFLHGEAKVGVNSQGGPRGATKFESENWLMPMAFRRVGNGTLQLRGMFSVEAFTLPPGGSGQLFQTGESYKGRPLVDAQHPHDLFMELSAQYTMPIGEHATWYTYFGYPGEPALGPVAFMHRASASENPTAPLSHHLQDSTHISFGVLTTGFTYRWFKLEGSVFNGREPGENRYDFEAGPWNSRSARLSFAPNDNWAFQISHGFLRNPEVLEPGDIRRTTASVQYNKQFNKGNWAAAFIWGRNHGSHDGEPFNVNSYTAESTVNFLNKNYLYTRLELVDKNELLTHDEVHQLGLASEHPSFRIGAYTFGYVRDVVRKEKFTLGLGADATFYSKPEILNSLYGENPVSYKFFMRFRLGGSMGGDHSLHDGMSGMSDDNTTGGTLGRE